MSNLIDFLLHLIETINRQTATHVDTHGYIPVLE